MLLLAPSKQRGLFSSLTGNVSFHNYFRKMVLSRIACFDLFRIISSCIFIRVDNLEDSLIIKSLKNYIN